MTDLFQTHNPQPEALPYDDTLRLVSDEITGRLNGAPPVFNDLTSYLAETAGKHIRAQSVLACAQREDGLVSSDAVKTAAAIELVHLATLVHDDVIDNAKTRRGTMALHKKFGVKSAVLCGDYLLCLALRLASELTPREERKKPCRPDAAGLSDKCIGRRDASGQQQPKLCLDGAGILSNYPGKDGILV